MSAAAIEALASYFSGPCVGLHSMGLTMPGAPRVAADAYFAARQAVGVQGYVSTEEARAAIARTLGASE